MRPDGGYNTAAPGRVGTGNARHVIRITLVPGRAPGVAGRTADTAYIALSAGLLLKGGMTYVPRGGTQLQAGRRTRRRPARGRQAAARAPSPLVPVPP